MVILQILTDYYNLILQSSWTKQAVEVDSPRPMSPCDRVAECPDSTCAQVIHSNAEISGNYMVPATAARECQEHDKQQGMQDILYCI